MVKLIIFDLDGTLVDSIEDITDALNFACMPLSVHFTIDETKRFVGSGVSRLIERAITMASHIPFHFNDILNGFLEYYSSHLVDKSKLFDGVIEILQTLENDYKKALVSNKKESLTREMLKHFEIDKHFNCILGGDSLQERKPSALPILEVLNRLDVQKNEALILGDSDQDIRAGKAAGIMTVAASYGYRERAKLTDADYIIDHIQELIPLVQTL